MTSVILSDSPSLPLTPVLNINNATHQSRRARKMGRRVLEPRLELNLTIRVTPELDKRIRLAAEAQDIAVGTMVRTWIEEGLAGVEPEIDRARREGRLP